jgi:predicted DNA-binding protein (MmcQ/YjbR family)
MNREELMDKLEEIQDLNNKTFLGSNESDLHQREDIANLFESINKQHQKELAELKAENEKLKMERDYCSMISTDLLNDSKWISVDDDLPKFIEGTTYSENVFAICKELEGIQVFIYCQHYDDNGDLCDIWANCYGNIDKDAEWDDNYTITHWKRISRTLPNL